MKTIKKKFDAVKWVRDVRDKFYAEHKNLKGEEYLNAIKQSIRKNDALFQKNHKFHRKTKNLV